MKGITEMFRSGRDATPQAAPPTPTERAHALEQRIELLDEFRVLTFKQRLQAAIDDTRFRGFKVDPADLLAQRHELQAELNAARHEASAAKVEQLAAAEAELVDRAAELEAIAAPAVETLLEVWQEQVALIEQLQRRGIYGQKTVTPVPLGSLRAWLRRVRER
jgi:hypothetical protein